MKIELDIPKGKYVVAVSGGVDSMVLLDVMLNKLGPRNLMVAYFNHKVRVEEEINKDLQPIRTYCARHQLKLVVGEYDGDDYSEAAMRDARYSYLENIRASLDYNAVITAHHADDIIETAIINLIRGTKGKGLVALTSSKTLMRPLLNFSKADILAYADKHNIEWHEDITNIDERYLRNYVRQRIVPMLREKKLLGQFQQAIDSQRPIEEEAEKLVSEILNANSLHYENGVGIFRSAFIQLPHAVSLKLLRSVLSDNDFAVEISDDLLQKSVVFAKTAKHHASMDLSKKSYLTITPDLIEVLLKD